MPITFHSISFLELYNINKSNNNNNNNNNDNNIMGLERRLFFISFKTKDERVLRV